MAYPKSAKFFTDTRVEVEEIIRENGKAKVRPGWFRPREEGEVEVGYCLELLNGRWLIEDILLNSMRLRLDFAARHEVCGRSPTKNSSGGCEKNSRNSRIFHALRRARAHSVVEVDKVEEVEEGIEATHMNTHS